jgi:hypothetical protein
MKLFNIKLFITTSSFIFCNLLLSAVYAEQPVKRLNDTGIQYSGDYPKGVNIGCSAQIKSFDVNPVQIKGFNQQQDCATGPSGANQNAIESIFSYHKISATGEKLSQDAQQWHCVIDEASRLMWEVKQDKVTPGNLHFFDDKFTWYNSNPLLNGGNIGDWNQQGKDCSGYTEGKPRSFCHVEQFVSRVNKQGLCGYQDWRLPTRAELTSLVHFGRSQPAIDHNFFPHTLNNFYWTANPVVGRPIEAWAINFEFGYTSPFRKTDPRPTRLVRDIKK